MEKEEMVNRSANNEDVLFIKGKELFIKDEKQKL